MKKLILGPLLILGIPQVLVSLFFLFVKAVLGWDHETAKAYVIITGVTTALSLIFIGGFLLGFDGAGAISEYQSEQRKLTAKREAMQDKLDQEIGIPRIK